MTITVIGVGLIGGSMALELKAKNFCAHIIGVDDNVIHQNEALKHGIVDEIGSLEYAIEKSSLIILATPVNISSKIIVAVMDQLTTQIMFDVGSTKEQLVALIKNHKKRAQFVATHPIAGTEYSGPKSAHIGLFNEKVTIICDQKDSNPEAVEKIISLYKTLGMDIIFMDSKDHDVHSAYVSHISHISSFALALSVMDKEKNEKNILNMAGSGFESTVRLAKSSKEMWTPIFLENKQNILEVLENYIDKLNNFKTAIKSSTSNDLNNLIEEANGIKKILKK
jgi:prephenate dehydrogenase